MKSMKVMKKSKKHKIEDTWKGKSGEGGNPWLWIRGNQKKLSGGEVCYLKSRFWIPIDFLEKLKTIGDSNMVHKMHPTEMMGCPRKYDPDTKAEPTFGQTKKIAQFASRWGQATRRVRSTHQNRTLSFPELMIKQVITAHPRKGCRGDNISVTMIGGGWFTNDGHGTTFAHPTMLP
jgi:hypothetical protein